jgi:hypothetical protein
MHRRFFLRSLGRTALAAAGAPQLLRATSLSGPTAPSNRLSVGFIGHGGISWGHFRDVLADPALQLRWLCDVDKKHLSDALELAQKAYAERAGTTSYEGLRTTGDFREVIADAGVDVVFVLTPDHWHALPTVLAARAGKDVFCEKPLSRTLAEGRVMLEAVQRAGIVTQVGNWQRSKPEFKRVVQLARAGALGQIERVRVGLPAIGGPAEPVSVSGAAQPVPEELDYEMWLGPAPRLPYVKERLHFHWRWCYEFAGGQLTDWINHHYDIAQVALGVSEEDPVRITDARAEFHTNSIYNTATHYAFTAHYAGGRKIEVSSEFPMGVRIDGSEGWVYANRGHIKHSSPALRALPLPSQGFSLGEGGHDANFFACVRSRAVSRGQFLHAYHSANAAHLANAALRSGHRELGWDEKKQRVLGAPGAERFLTANYRAPWHLPV